MAHSPRISRNIFFLVASGLICQLSGGNSAHLSIPKTAGKAGQVPPQQTGSETANADISARTDNVAVQSQENGGTTQKLETQQDAQKIFEESLRQMMPLNEGQIPQFRERSDERGKAQAILFFSLKDTDKQFRYCYL